jgi:hypothetical protein
MFRKNCCFIFMDSFPLRLRDVHRVALLPGTVSHRQGILEGPNPLRANKIACELHQNSRVVITVGEYWAQPRCDISCQENRLDEAPITVMLQANNCFPSANHHSVAVICTSFLGFMNMSGMRPEKDASISQHALMSIAVMVEPASENPESSSPHQINVQNGSGIHWFSLNPEALTCV